MIGVRFEGGEVNLSIVVSMHACHSDHTIIFFPDSFRLQKNDIIIINIIKKYTMHAIFFFKVHFGTALYFLLGDCAS